MNRMLVRVDASAQRQRRLVADVSHDLQGPLAAQRVSLELALAAPGAVDTELLRATCSARPARWSGWSTTCWSLPPPTREHPR